MGSNTNLPAPIASLIGRERDLAEAESLLLEPQTRLLTLTGAPGAGKTRLALALAASASYAFADGVWVVQLASLRKPQLVLPTLADALGVRTVGRRPVRAALIEVLRQLQTLVVFDNFEHLLAAAPACVELLGACPDLKILATSRAALRVSGERQFPVPPLELPDLDSLPGLEGLGQVPSVRLFVERARAVRREFQLEPANAAAVAELCVRLDGLPLAIELAAARTPLLEPDALLARMERRLSLLVDGPRDLPHRHRTLRNAVGWSYDLLSLDEQYLFRQLGVFVGGCTLEAAIAVAGCHASSHDQVLSGLGALLEHGLLRRVPQPGDLRVEMLETIREFALEQLSLQDELESAQQRHVRYFLDFGESVANPRLDEPDGPMLMAQIERDHDNFRSALRWLQTHGPAEEFVQLAGALWEFWNLRGHWTEGLSWLQAALSHAASASPSNRTRALLGAGLLFYDRGEYARAVALVREAVTVLRESGDPSLPFMLNMLAGIMALAGYADEAAEVATEVVAIREREGHPNNLAWVLLICGNVAACRADFHGALKYYERSLRTRHGQPANAVDMQLLQGMAAVRAGQGDVAGAQRDLEQALARSSEIGDERFIARTLLTWGDLLMRSGEPATGRAHLQRSLALFKRLGEAVGVIVASRLLGEPLDADFVAQVGDVPIRMWWRMNLGRDMPSSPALQPTDAAERLTAREAEILSLLGQRYSNGEIAEQLVLSVRTVERHVANIYAKTGITSRREAVALARHFL